MISDRDLRGRSEVRRASTSDAWQACSTLRSGPPSTPHAESASFRKRVQLQKMISDTSTTSTVNWAAGLVPPGLECWNTQDIRHQRNPFQLIDSHSICSKRISGMIQWLRCSTRIDYGDFVEVTICCSKQGFQNTPPIAWNIQSLAVSRPALTACLFGCLDVAMYRCVNAGMAMSTRYLMSSRIMFVLCGPEYGLCVLSRL